MHFADRLRFAFCFSYGGFLCGFGFQNKRGLFAFGDKDGRLFLTFGNQNGFAPFAFGPHLLFHRFLNGVRRNDVFYFNAVYLNAPRVGRFVQNTAHSRVDDVAARKRAVQFQFADNVTQRRCRQVLDGVHRIFDAVGKQFRVGYLKINDGVDHHRNVVFGDNRLRLKIEHALFERYPVCDAVDKRNFYVKSHRPRAHVAAQAFNDKGF